MYSAIFSQIKVLVGRTFVLSGLLPSALLIAGYYIYKFGYTGIDKLVSEIVQEANRISVELTMVFITWMIIAVLFVSFRSLILYVSVSLPGFLLRPIRYYLETRMLKKRQQALQYKEISLFETTVLDWSNHKFSKPKFIPPFIDAPNIKQALKHSGVARRIIEYLMDERYSRFHIPTRSQFKAIKQGLCGLYAYGAGKQSDLDYEEEIECWKKLGQDVLAKEVLQQVGHSIRREHAAAHGYFASYPDDAWIKPTRIGNLMSSLDDYSESRYGIDTATMWSRVWWVITDTERKEIMQSKFQVELFLNHMGAFLVLLFIVLLNSVLSVFDLNIVSTSLSYWEFISYVSLLIIFSVLSYRSAVYSFLTLKDKTISLIDLYRHVLLKKLGYSPGNVQEEIELYKELRGFFVQSKSRNGQRPLNYE